MTNYSQEDIEQLAERVRMRVEMDELHARERREAYRAKRRLRLHQIITEVVIRYCGELVQSVVDQIKRLLPQEWFY